MNELVNAPISPWYTIPAAAGLLALTFALLPGMFVHLAVLIYPKDHPRRREFTAELYTVPYIKRPFWAAGTLVRCLFEGLPERAKASRRHRPNRDYLLLIDENGKLHEIKGEANVRAYIKSFGGDMPRWQWFTPEGLQLAHIRREISKAAGRPQSTLQVNR